MVVEWREICCFFTLDFLKWVKSLTTFLTFLALKTCVPVFWSHNWWGAVALGSVYGGVRSGSPGNLKCLCCDWCAWPRETVTCPACLCTGGTPALGGPAQPPVVLESRPEMCAACTPASPQPLLQNAEMQSPTPYRPAISLIALPAGILRNGSGYGTLQAPGMTTSALCWTNVQQSGSSDPPPPAFSVFRDMWWGDSEPANHLPAAVNRWQHFESLRWMVPGTQGIFP